MTTLKIFWVDAFPESPRFRTVSAVPSVFSKLQFWILRFALRNVQPSFPLVVQSIPSIWIRGTAAVH